MFGATRAPRRATNLAACKNCRPTTNPAASRPIHPPQARPNFTTAATTILAIHLPDFLSSPRSTWRPWTKTTLPRNHVTQSRPSQTLKSQMTESFPAFSFKLMFRPFFKIFKKTFCAKISAKLKLI